MILDKVLLGAALFALPLAGHALVAVSYHPADAVDSLTTLTADSSLDHNPGFVPVVNGEGYENSTRAVVNAADGTIRGYAGYAKATAGAVTRTQNLIATIFGTGEPALPANVSGTITYTDATVAGAGAGSATISLDLDGSFNYLAGSPGLGLLGALSVTVVPGGDIFAANSYLIGGQFSNADPDTWIPDAASIFTRDTWQVLGPFGDILSEPDLSGISHSIDYIDDAIDSLALRVSLTLPVSPGDDLVIAATAAGSATHAFLEDFRDVAEGATGEVDAAEGFVDFLSTASLAIELSFGLSIEGSDAPPASIVSTASPVPLPAAGWLFLSAALGLIGMLRRKVG
jgi:hypothetical protein